MVTSTVWELEVYAQNDARAHTYAQFFLSEEWKGAIFF